jgi:hypothetical protein
MFRSLLNPHQRRRCPMEDFAQGSATGGGPTFSFLWFEVSGNLLLASIKAGPQADEATLRTLVESIRETP